MEQRRPKGYLKPVDEVAAFIEERCPDYEYAGNYTGCDGRVDLRCKKCGLVFNRSMVSIRHKDFTCPECRRKRVEEARRIKAEIREQSKRRAEERKAKKREQRKREAEERKAEIERRRIERIHRCPVCGEITDKPKYCSAGCRNKAHNAKHDYERRAKIKAGLKDKDITVKGLFLRDNGVCQMCGKPCDFSDYVIEQGNFIAGGSYPSVDHIVPLAKGGEHSWDNVQLAHCRCNTLAGAKTGLQ